MARGLVKAAHAERYDSPLQRILDQLGENEPVGISMRAPARDAGAAVFANYHLFPHPTRFYESLDQYRADVFQGAPKKLIRIDLGRTNDPRLMTYLDIRHEEVAESSIIRDPKPSSRAYRDPIVPIALAIDGAPGNTYLTDGVLAADVDTTAMLTFYPSGQSQTFSLRAGEPLVLRDVVYTITSRLDQGWLQVTSPVPLRAGFWFVNRGKRHAVLLPLFEGLPPSPQRVASGRKLWVLNPGERVIDVVVNGHPYRIEPHALATLSPAPPNAIEGDRPPKATKGDRPPNVIEGDRPPKGTKGDRPPNVIKGDRPFLIEGDRPFLAFSAQTEDGRETFQWP